MVIAYIFIILSIFFIIYLKIMHLFVNIYVSFIMIAIRGLSAHVEYFVFLPKTADFSFIFHWRGQEALFSAQHCW